MSGLSSIDPNLGKPALVSPAHSAVPTLNQSCQTPHMASVDPWNAAAPAQCASAAAAPLSAAQPATGPGPAPSPAKIATNGSVSKT